MLFTYGAPPYNRPNVIAVAATDHNDNLANFSNYGATTVHLARPGVRHYSTVLSNNYGYKSGTSMASPHVAGAAALILSVPAFANLSVTDLRDRLLNCGEAKSTLSGKTITGKRLNVARAINGTGGCATSPTPNPVPAITTISPTFATAGGAQFTLTVNGSNFVPGSVVRWNGNKRPTTYVSATQLTATSAASLIAASGSATVTVFNPAPGGGTSNGAAVHDQPGDPDDHLRRPRRQDLRRPQLHRQRHRDVRPDRGVRRQRQLHRQRHHRRDHRRWLLHDHRLAGGQRYLWSGTGGAATFTIAPAHTTVIVPVVIGDPQTNSATLRADLTSIVLVDAGTVLLTVRQGETTIGDPISADVADGAASTTFDITDFTQGLYLIEASYSGAGDLAAGVGVGIFPSAKRCKRSPSIRCPRRASMAMPSITFSATATLEPDHVLGACGEPVRGERD